MILRRSQIIPVLHVVQVWCSKMFLYSDKREIQALYNVRNLYLHYKGIAHIQFMLLRLITRLGFYFSVLFQLESINRFSFGLLKLKFMCVCKIILKLYLWSVEIEPIAWETLTVVELQNLGPYAKYKLGPIRSHLKNAWIFKVKFICILNLRVCSFFFFK